MKNGIKKLNFSEYVRKRPGMFLGATGSKGIINLVKGLILDTNRDLKNEKNLFHFSILADNKFQLKIETDNNLDFLIPESNGKKDYFSKIHFNILEVLTNSYEIEKPDNSKLILSWSIDKSIMRDTEVDFINLSEVLTQIAYLHRDNEILITDDSKKYLNQSYLNFPQGIKYLYDRFKIEALGTPKFEISFDDRIKNNHYQIFLGYRTDWFPNPQIVSFANEIRTICGGSLVNGIIEGLILGCKEYVRNCNFKSYKIERKKIDNGLILICSVKGDEFRYGGSFKESLIDDEVESAVKQLIEKLTIKFIETNKEKADNFLWRFDENQLTSGIM